MENSTLRKWLTEAGFDWDNGRILYQEWGDDPGWSNAASASFIPNSHEILDSSFYDGFGVANCPAIIAEDNDAIYFPGQYDGSTWLVTVKKDLTYYLNVEHETPYVGG